MDSRPDTAFSKAPGKETTITLFRMLATTLNRRLDSIRGKAALSRPEPSSSVFHRVSWRIDDDHLTPTCAIGMIAARVPTGNGQMPAIDHARAATE